MTNLKPLSLFAFFLTPTCERISSKDTALKMDVLLDRKMYCLLVRACIFQPGNCTGCGSERVKLGEKRPIINRSPRTILKEGGKKEQILNNDN